MKATHETNDIERLLEGGSEEPQLDFKESCPWDPSSYAKDFLAMTNITDGGRIIIGVAQETNGTFKRTGIKPDHKKTYIVDIMKDQLAKYTDPFVEFSVSFPVDTRGIEYCVIRVEPFKEVPVICKIPDTNRGLYAGGVYYRNRNKRVESALVSNSYDMRDIIERSVIKMHNRAQQIGYIFPPETRDELIVNDTKTKLKKERGNL